MQIVDRIGMPVMKPVMCRPPQNALLQARLSENRQEKLRNSADLKGSMTEVTVIAGCYTKHSNRIGGQQPGKVRPFKGDKEKEEACDVKWPEGNDRIEVESPHERHHTGTTLWRLQQHEP